MGLQDGLTATLQDFPLPMSIILTCSSSPPFTLQHKQSQMGDTLIIEVNLNGTIDKVD